MKFHTPTIEEQLSTKIHSIEMLYIIPLERTDAYQQNIIMAYRAE